MSKNYTPGPWTRDGYSIFKRDFNNNWEIGCVTRGGQYKFANATLMAAAPELLLVLETALATHRTEQGLSCDPGCWCWSAEEVIKKAI